MTTTAPTPTSSLHRMAVVLSSFVIPLPLLVSRFIEAGLDAVNPAGIDVRTGLAYLREILGFSLGFLALLLLIISALLVEVYRRERRVGAISLPLFILIGQVALAVLLAVMVGVVSAIDGGYEVVLS